MGENRNESKTSHLQRIEGGKEGKNEGEETKGEKLDKQIDSK
jgi:hypothetical protein